MPQRPLRRETVLTLDLNKRRDWHYYATIERDRGVSVYARAPDDDEPQLVLETGVEAVWGSHYEVNGKKLVRRYDPRREARQAKQNAVQEQRARTGAAPGFREAVREIEALLGRKAKRLEEGGHDFRGFAIYEIAAGRGKGVEPAELQDRFLPRDACPFYLQLPEGPSKRRPALGIMATRDPRDVVHMLQDVGIEDVLKVVGPLLKSKDAWVEAANIDFLLLRFRRIPRNHKAVCRQVISQLEQEELTLDDLQQMDRDLMAKRELFLWWD